MDHNLLAHYNKNISIKYPDIKMIQSPVIPRQPAVDFVPLLPGQKNIWLAQKLQPRSPVYNLAAAAPIIGSIDTQKLKNAFKKIIAHNHILKANIQDFNGEPFFKINNLFQLEMPLLDFSTSSHAPAAIKQWLLKNARRPFQFNCTEPLIRTALLKKEHNQYLLFVNIHHIIADDQSLHLLTKKLLSFYSDQQDSLKSEVKEKANEIQFTDYLLWKDEQNKKQNQPIQQPSKAAPGSTQLQLPTDFKRPLTANYQGARTYFSLSAQLTRRIQQYSRQQNATPVMTLLSVFTLLLYRYTYQTDLTIGIPFSNRNLPAMQEMLGCFVQPLALSIAIDPQQEYCFKELLEQVKNITLKAYDQTQTSLGNDEQQEKLIRVMFSMLMDTQTYCIEPGLSIDTFQDIDNQTVKFDLTLQMWQNKNTLEGVFEYRTDLFKTETIEHLKNHFTTLLTASMNNPDQSIFTLPLLTDQEWHQMIYAWNDTGKAYPDQHCIHNLFEQQVIKTPQAVAVAFEDRSLTYQELNQKANQLARHMISLGIKPEMPVVLSIDRSIELVIGLLGILKSGATYVPMDPAYPLERRAFMVNDLDLSLIITTQDLVEGLPAHKTELICLDRDQDIIAQYDRENPAISLNPDQVAYIIYTSGSTGRPKGVRVKHRGVCNLAREEARLFHLNPGCRVLQFASFSFDSSVWEIVMTICTGAALQMASLYSIIPGPALLEVLKKNRITHVTLPASALAALPYASLPDLKVLITAGEAVSLDLVRQWAPGRRFFNSYGPTENSVCTSNSELFADSPCVHIGKPIANTETYILDPHLQPVPIGVAGELYIGGVGLAKDYLNRPGLTKQCFIPNPFTQKWCARLYKSGDLVRYLADGIIEFLGRVDHQVKIRGFRIELGEIEAVLKQHAHVLDTIVMAKEDQKGSKNLIAYIVPQKQTQTSTSQYIEFLKQKLPDYMIPGFFISLPGFPRLPNNKVNRKALPEPDLARPELKNEYAAAQTEEEKAMVQIWQEVLGIDKIGTNDNFFELGGHSLLATKITSRVQNGLGIDIPLAHFFTQPTIKHQIKYLSQHKHNQQIKMVKKPNASPPLLSAGQKRLWFLHYLQPDSVQYNTATLIDIKGELNRDCLQKCLNEIVKRHAIFRTRFKNKDNQILALTSPYTPFQLRQLNTNDSQTRQNAIQNEVNTAFDLEKDQLWRFLLLRTADRHYQLVFTMHHIICDEWSLNIFDQELQTLYEAFQNQQPSPLSPLKYQYIDFAYWQNQWLKTEQAQQQLQWWKNHLKECRPVLQLPVNPAKSEQLDQPGQYHSFQIKPELSKNIKSLAHQSNMSAFMILFAAFNLLLYRYTHSSDIIVGTSVTNRNCLELEEMFGFFLNALPLRTCFQAELTVKQLLSQVKETILGGFANKDYPFDQLVDALKVKREADRSPLFQVMFVFQKEAGQKNKMAECCFTSREIDNHQSKFDLTLFMWEENNAFQGKVEYNSQLFPADMIERMAHHFEQIVQNSLQQPDQKIAAIPLLTTREQMLMLYEWNKSNHCTEPRDHVDQVFEKQVQKTPRAIALQYQDQQLTYDQLNQKANQLAHYLRLKGVKTETIVGVCLERCPRLVIALLAILKAGAAYIPIDPKYPQERISFMLNDSRMSFVITQTQFIQKLTHAQTEIIDLQKAEKSIAEQATENGSYSHQADHLAYIIYTSGSTGKPKGTMITHTALINYLNWCCQAYQLTKGAGAPVHSSISFDATITSLYSPLLTGKKVVLIPEEDEIPALARTLASGEVFSLVKITPVHLELLSQLLPPEAAQNVNALIIGGEALSGGNLGFWQDYSPQTRIINEYGPTETVVGCCVYEIPRGKKISGAVPIGRPIAQTALYILNEELQPAPIGISGELYIGGRGLARGYLNRPGLTQQRFINNPFIPGEQNRLYKTGDLARYLADGTIEFLGRTDHQVKIRGFRIELGEIEAVLIDHPAIREAAIIVHISSEQRKQLAAYVVKQKQTDLDSQAVRQYLAAKLPDYMVPAYFIFLPELPLTANGKVDRAKLPRPESSKQKSLKSHVPARTETEKLITRVWQEILKAGSIGIEDNFFELGGDSILIIQIIARLKNHQLHLTAQQFFKHQTIADQAAIVRKIETTRAEQGLIRGEIPLTPIQHWFFEKKLTHIHHYNQAYLFEVNSDLQESEISLILKALLSQHDALRICFQFENQHWKQINQAQINPIKLKVVDLSSSDQAARPTVIERECRAAQAGLNIEQGPLLRAVLFKDDPGRPNRLFMVIHHLLVDGVSWRIILQDFSTAYQQLKDSQPIKLPAKTTSYQQWANCQLEYAKSNALKHSCQVWKSLNRIKIKKIPVDFPAAIDSNLQKNSCDLTVSLDQQNTHLLIKEVPSVYNTRINDLLLTALAFALSQWTNNDTHLIHLEGHGREYLSDDIDLSRTVGWFTSVFPLVLRVEADKDLKQTIKCIKEDLRQIPQQGMSYGILNYLNQEQENKADFSTLPRAEICFNYMGQFDNVMANQPFQSYTEENIGAYQSLENQRSYLIEINASLYQDQLTVCWTYNDTIHNQATIARLAEAMNDYLKQIIVHCRSREAGGMTASDFPLARINQNILDQLYQKQEKIEDIYLLSPMQEGMLFHSLYNDDSDVYYEQLFYTLQGEIDEEKFKQAWQQNIDNYAALRTAFIWSKLEDPHQIVYQSVALPWTSYDWSDKNTSQQEEAILDFMLNDRKKGFDLTTAPLYHFHFFKLSPNQYYFLWTHHHLLLDGWSVLLILKQVFADYHALLRDQALSVHKTAPYSRYINWLQQVDQSLARQYWSKNLAGMTAPTALPGGKRADFWQIQSSEIIDQTLAIEPALYEALLDFSRQNHITLGTIVQGAWALLLSRYTSEKDVVFGMTVSGRLTAVSGIEEMGGLFINSLPVRIKVDGNSKLIDWLQQIQSDFIEREQYSYSSLVDIHACSELAGGQPLFGTLLVFENYPAELYESQGSQDIKIVDIKGYEKTNFPLNIVVEAGSHFSFQVKYNEALFTQAAVTDLMQHFINLLTRMTENPGQSLSGISILSPQEYKQLIYQWNDTEKSYPNQICIHTRFEEQVKNNPRQIAIEYKTESMSYQELNEKSNQVAHYLVKMKIKAETIIAVFMDRSIELMIVLLGIMKAGAAYVPIDTHYPAERINFILNDIEPEFLITKKAFLNKLNHQPFKMMVFEEKWVQISNEKKTNPNLDVKPDQLCYLIYTSGSTGKPKGVMIEHQGLMNYLNWCWETFLDLGGSGSPVQTSIAFDATITSLYTPLLLGQKIIMIPEENELDEMIAALKKGEKMGLGKITPAHLELLSRLLPPQAAQNISGFVIGGESLSANYLEYWFQNNPSIVLVNEYGPTEAVVGTTVLPIDPQKKYTGILPIGKPLPNYKVYILDPFGHPAPVGVAGEIYIGGVTVARGYFNRPELNRQKFLNDPFSSRKNSRMYRTGDLACWLPDGNIEFVGRVDNQVKLRGYRIELGEIEAVLNEISYINESIVLLKEEKNQSDHFLVAYYICNQKEKIAVEKIRQQLKNILPDYMIPTYLIQLNEMPLTTNGKIDRNALPEPSQSDLNEQTHFIEPQTETEKQLASIWKTVLDVEKIGRADHFFNLGGHSLKATRILSRIEEIFQVEFRLQLLFEFPQLKQLANQLDKLKKEQKKEKIPLMKKISRSSHRIHSD